MRNLRLRSIKSLFSKTEIVVELVLISTLPTTIYEEISFYFKKAELYIVLWGTGEEDSRVLRINESKDLKFIIIYLSYSLQYIKKNKDLLLFVNMEHFLKSILAAEQKLPKETRDQLGDEEKVRCSDDLQHWDHILLYTLQHFCVCLGPCLSLNVSAEHKIGNKWWYEQVISSVNSKLIPLLSGRSGINLKELELRLGLAPVHPAGRE